MIPPTDAQRRAWMKQWRSAAIALARVRQHEASHADLARIAADLEDACNESARARGTVAASGLTEQQRIFHRLDVA